MESPPVSPTPPLIGISDPPAHRNEYPPQVFAACNGRGYYETDGRPQSYYDPGGSYYERQMTGRL